MTAPLLVWSRVPWLLTPLVVLIIVNLAAALVSTRLPVPSLEGRVYSDLIIVFAQNVSLLVTLLYAAGASASIIVCHPRSRLLTLLYAISASTMIFVNSGLWLRLVEASDFRATPQATSAVLVEQSHRPARALYALCPPSVSLLAAPHRLFDIRPQSKWRSGPPVVGFTGEALFLHNSIKLSAPPPPPLVQSPAWLSLHGSGEASDLRSDQLPAGASSH